MDIEIDSQAVLNLERVTSAYLGAAVGDALGWPFEGRARILPSKGEWKGAFLTWEKKSGSRFHPYQEQVGAGEYSDDTQLILALTRSRLKTKKWWIDFAQTELPFWTCYERGGGGDEAVGNELANRTCPVAGRTGRIRTALFKRRRQRRGDARFTTLCKGRKIQ